MQPKAFKRRELFQDVLCLRNYAERVVESFSNQIKEEYYGGNRYMTKDVIELEQFSALPQAYINSSTLSLQCHAVFHSFLSDDSKQDSATTTRYRKRLVSLLKDKKLLTALLSTIWGKH